MTSRTLELLRSAVRNRDANLAIALYRRYALGLSKDDVLEILEKRFEGKSANSVPSSSAQMIVLEFLRLDADLDHFGASTYMKYRGKRVRVSDHNAVNQRSISDIYISVMGPVGTWVGTSGSMTGDGSYIRGSVADVMKAAKKLL